MSEPTGGALGPIGAPSNLRHVQAWSAEIWRTFVVVGALHVLSNPPHAFRHIARRLGIHRSTFYVRLERAGVHLRPREALTSSEIGQAADLYAQGRSLADIGAVFEVDTQTVRNHLARAGVPIRKRRSWT